MIDKNKTYKTRDGREVRIYATDGANGKIHGAMLDKEGWEHRTWTGAGRIMLCEEHPYDLIEVRPRHKRTVWLNVYNNGIREWRTKEDADRYAGDTRIACIKVELDFEEGEGL
jgi:hypothetical protein